MTIFDKSRVIEACVNTLNNSKDCLSDAHIAAEFALRNLLSGSQLEQLQQLVNSGPCWDGDVISKTARDDLMRLGLAGRACVKGEQGYTVANYRGWSVLKASDFSA